MKSSFSKNSVKKIVFVLSIVFYTACSSKNEVKNTIDEEVLDVQVHEEEAQNPQKRNKNKLERMLIKKADSCYFAGDFKQAQTLYDMALNNVTDAETKNYLLQKIADIKGKVNHSIKTDSIENTN